MFFADGAGVGFDVVTIGFAFETVTLAVSLDLAPLLSVASSFTVNVPSSVHLIVVSTEVSFANVQLAPASTPAPGV